MTVLSMAMVIALATTAYVVLRWPRFRCFGDTPLPRITFLAILFTSGLDVGLIMFPLIDFETYASGVDYQFASPLVIEFGFWGGLVWGFYILTTLYFCALEPRLQLFQRPAVKFVHNLVVIATCAFTAYLFLAYLPSYLPGISQAVTYSLVVLVVSLAVLSSTRLTVLKYLSVGSTLLFLCLIGVVWLASGVGVRQAWSELAGLSAYGQHLGRFLTPINDYHGFYLSWWFAWSIMIGQFVARFTNGIEAWKLALAVLIIPSIPIALWFSVLFGLFKIGQPIATGLNLMMMGVGVLFVINSLDSLTRLYAQNLGWTAERLGFKTYMLAHVTLLLGLVALYQFTPLKIEWIGMIVIALYAAVYGLILRYRARLSD
jgi:choline-glycine betaine transporter